MSEQLFEWRMLLEVLFQIKLRMLRIRSKQLNFPLPIRCRAGKQAIAAVSYVNITYVPTIHFIINKLGLFSLCECFLGMPNFEENFEGNYIIKMCLIFLKWRHCSWEQIGWGLSKYWHLFVYLIMINRKIHDFLWIFSFASTILHIMIFY